MRSFLVGAGGFLAVTGSQKCGYPGAGPLACIISAFVAATGWKWRAKKQHRDKAAISINGEDDQDQEDSVAKVFEYAWIGLQPVLFAFIGTDLKFELISSSGVIFPGLLVLAFGLTVSAIRLPALQSTLNDSNSDRPVKNFELSNIRIVKSFEILREQKKI